MQNFGAGIRSLSGLATPIARQTIFLWGIDLFSNLLDFIYHFYLGRTLSARDFAAIQTANAILLIFITAFGVLQPAVARFSAEENLKDHPNPAAGIFRQFFTFAVVLGILLASALWLLRQPISDLLNIPVLIVAAATMVVLFSLQRPVVLGVFQGTQRFIAFGVLRGTQAFTRLMSGIILISLGWGLLGATLALPLGQAVLVIAGLGLLGRQIWKPEPVSLEHSLSAGLQLSLAALVAYAALMSLLNIDLIWVNRYFSAAISAEYATAVLLRRSLILFPGAIMVVTYPRIITYIESHRYPDSLLWKASAAISGAIISISVVYFFFGQTIISVTFGPQYKNAALLVLPMALGILGFSLGSLWLNLYLATSPLPFVLFMAAVAGIQAILFAIFNSQIEYLIWVYTATGWIVFSGGVLLYIFWLKPGLKQKFIESEGSLDPVP
jgi:O-antigen/teichoic acid export membrane protein